MNKYGEVVNGYFDTRINETISELLQLTKLTKEQLESCVTFFFNIYEEKK